MGPVPNQAGPHANFFLLGLLPDLNFRFVLARDSATTAEVAERHRAAGGLRRLMGECMIGAFLLSTHSVKSARLVVSLHMEFTGPLKRLISFAGSDGGLRATFTASEEGWGEDDLIGRATGILQVNRWNRSEDKRAYTSMVEMRDGNLARNLEEYMARSDQIQSFIDIASVEERETPTIAAYMFQALPGATADQVDAVLDMIQGRSPLEIISRFVGTGDEQRDISSSQLSTGHAVSVLKSGGFYSYCDCSREKVRNVIYMMGRDSAEGLIRERGSVEVFCEFCKRRYDFAPPELDAIFS